MKVIALRIDVDTYRGTGHGVPTLCRILGDHGLKGTFYFSVGPDNMGRHLWRLFKPSFLWKMMRTDAAGLYGPEIILMGTAWHGPKIGRRFHQEIRRVKDAGHEIGFHAWDHQGAQAKLITMSEEAMTQEIQRGVEELTSIVGEAPVTSAAPGWRANDQLLLVKSKFPFRYNSDCRGSHPFYPVVNGKRLEQLQIPVTLPTYDEVLGRNGVSDQNYNDYQVSLLKPDTLNVLTIHAEAEGGRCATMFEAYLERVVKLGYRIIPLGEVATEFATTAPAGRIELGAFPGREGMLALQKPL